LTVLFLIEACCTNLHAQVDQLGVINVVRLDRRFDKLVPLNVKIEKIAGGPRRDEASD